MQRHIRLVSVFTALALTGCNSAVEKAVRDQLIDGESAVFKEVSTCPNDTSISHGQVNAKNRMGAFVGFEPFFYDGSIVSFASSATFTAAMNRCYGNVAEEAAVTVQEVAANGKSDELGAESAWITSEDKNPVDDTKTVRATLLSADGKSSMGDSVSLTIRCESNKTELFVNWADYLGDDSNDVYEDWKNVTVRVGDTPAKVERWDISTDSKATFAPGSIVKLIKDMAASKRLVLKTVPYNENPVTAVFDLTGIEKAVQPIAKECGWSL
ncbi:type VI secretion system-associated protein TagO [Novosphingobium jiangmenense]|uniref:Lipoprotein n=1 Tax=Novosphingobium jiangmenense TaxID=2791981 RepID=A0ABS0HCP2_9SPHN|nr:type VI secretion system-associated protein TagO [Novosphingobium jiangmenense]MBF9150048.1 hypothetical protein [Novosphingobium jiangmenense]